MGKKSNKTTSKTVYGNTTTTNPYVTSKTTNSGTTSKFNAGTAFDSINNFVNANMNSLLEQYLNPTLESVTNQAKLNSFTNTLNSQTAKNLENNIINPLSNRNMVRSSQATNLYNNLAQSNASAISDYANQLIAENQQNIGSMLANLMLLYMNGYNVLSDTQKQSLTTSQGNATQSQKSTESGISASEMTQLALQMAMLATGLGTGAGAATSKSV